MGLAMRSYSSPKLNASRADYKDACKTRPVLGRAAIADGASNQSYNAKQWAEILVAAFVREPPCTEHAWDQWLKGSMAEWHRSINWDSLSLFQEGAAVRGAYSTFLGIQFGLSDIHCASATPLERKRAWL